MLILITGASGSGKSEYAEKICCGLAGSAKKYYIATMQPYGAEGAQRIRRHHALRQGKGFETIEQYQNVSKAFDKVQTEVVSHAAQNEKPVRMSFKSYGK